MSIRVIALARPLEFGLQVISQVQDSHSQVDNPKSLHLQLPGRLYNATTFSSGESQLFSEARLASARLSFVSSEFSLSFPSAVVPIYPRL